MITRADFGCEFETRDEGDGVAAFTGIASTNREDSYGTVIEARAFEPIGHVVMLRDHDTSQVIGGWRSFEQHGGELLVEGELNLGVEKARETYSLLKRKHLTGLSVGFSIRDPDHDIYRDEKTRRRHIRKAILRECSIVAFPATPGAAITSVRSVDEWLTIHGLEREALDELQGLLRGEETASDLRGAVEGLLAELKARARS